MLKWVLLILIFSTQISCIYVQRKEEFYAYQTIDGERHILPIDVTTIDSGDVYYCYEHETIHKIQILYPNNITPSSQQ